MSFDIFSSAVLAQRTAKPLDVLGAFILSNIYPLKIIQNLLQK